MNWEVLDSRGAKWTARGILSLLMTPVIYFTWPLAVAVIGGVAGILALLVLVLVAFPGDNK